MPTELYPPIDALLLINHINAVGSHALTSPLPGIPFPDTNGDNNISPGDVLLVVNHLNSVGNQEGEGSVRIASADPVDRPFVSGFAGQLSASGTSLTIPAPAADKRQAIEEDDASAEDFFADLGRHDFARQVQTMSGAARASLAAKSQDIESALDSLFGANELEDELALGLK